MVPMHSILLALAVLGADGPSKQGGPKLVSKSEPRVSGDNERLLAYFERRRLYLIRRGELDLQQLEAERRELEKEKEKRGGMQRLVQHQQQIAAVKRGIADLKKTKNPRPETLKKFVVGAIGYLPGKVTIEKVIAADEAVVRIGEKQFILRGFNFADKKAEERLGTSTVVAVTGTRSFALKLGEPRQTVTVLEPFDVEKYSAELDVLEKELPAE